VAAPAPARPGGERPDHRLPVSRNSLRTAPHTVRAVLEVRALGTLVWTLRRRRRRRGGREGGRGRRNETFKYIYIYICIYISIYRFI